MKDGLKAAGIWTPGTTLHLKTDPDLPVPLIENAHLARLAEVEGC